MFPLPRLYAIVDRETLDARRITVADYARELQEAGVTLLQYRDKAGGPGAVLRACEEIAAAFASVDATLILNDRADLAALLGWGVHLGQGDLPVADARRVLGGGERTFPSGMTTKQVRKVGVSTHTEDQVRAADASETDYVAIGPVFGTRTKLDAEPPVGLDGVRRARALTKKQLVAIGGINRENARSVMDAGADAVAVIGGLFVSGESVGRVARDFLELLR